MTQSLFAFVDERLSSVAAENSLRDQAVSPEQQREAVDRLAAKVILDTWLDDPASAN